MRVELCADTSGTVARECLLAPTALPGSLTNQRSRREAGADAIEHTCVDCGTVWVNTSKGTLRCRSCASRINGAVSLSARRAKAMAKTPMPCKTCGLSLTSRGRKYCSDKCRSRAVKTTALSQRSPLRAAYEDGDCAGILDAIRGKCEIDPTSGCWVGFGRLKDGYPTVNLARRTFQGHRLSLEAKLGKPLGKQAAHHVCANSACVNPDHLQPVTARENTAEMLARTYMESRIADLESALAAHDPSHPLLAEVGVVAA